MLPTWAVTLGNETLLVQLHNTTSPPGGDPGGVEVRVDHVAALALTAFLFWAYATLRAQRHAHIPLYASYSVDAETGLATARKPRARGATQRAIDAALCDYDVEARGARHALTCATCGRTREVAFAEPEQCSICLTEFAGGEAVRVLPACGHMFHTACIDVWLKRSARCPLCTRPAF